MNLVPHSDLLDRLVPAQCLQRYLRFELPCESPSCRHRVSLLQSAEIHLSNLSNFLGPPQLESRQESTRRVAQSMTATRYRKPHWTGIYVMFALQT